MVDSDALRTLVEARNVDAVVTFFRGMSEDDRRAYAPVCAEWYRELRNHRTVQLSPNSWTTNPLGPGVDVAVFCTGTYSELAKLPRWTLPRGDTAFAVLADRRPPWTEKWAQHLLDGERYWQDWTLVRRLVREGLIEKPDHPNYVLGMISGINGFGLSRAPVKECLDADPELLADEVWRLFEHEGGGQNSLANCDRFRGDGWSGALMAYAADGTLSRSKLLGCCLAALRRDFNHYRAKWFAKFHDLLKPSKEEQRSHAPSYLDLLGVSAPTVVSWALKKVEAQAKSGAYTADELTAGLRPALEARGKGVAKSALKLLAKAAPEARQQTGAAAVVALGEEDADGRAAALDLIEKHGERDQLALVLTGYVELVAPSLRARVLGLVGAPAGGGPEEATTPAAPDVSEVTPELRRLFAVDALLAQLAGDTWVLPAAVFDGTELPRLAVHAPVVPVQDLDELIDLGAQVLEGSATTDDLERAFDGLSRMCDQRPDDFERRTGPLLKRAEQLMQRDHTPFAGEGPASDFCGLIHAWVTGEVASLSFSVNQHGNEMVEVVIGGEVHGQYAGNTRKTVGALSRRAHALSRRVARREASPLLSAPTHEGCWIDPRVLVERVNAWRGAEPEVLDVVLALLRLAPEHRGEALAQLSASDDEWQQAILHALGGAARVGTSLGLWGAAARAQRPWDVDEAVSRAFPESGPDVGTPAEYALSFAPDKRGHVRMTFAPELEARGVDIDCIPLVLHAERGNSMWELGGLGGRSDASIRWTASAWPGARESFFAGALVQLAYNLDWWEARWYEKTLLEPLLEPGTPLRQMGLLLLCTVLAAKEPGEYGLATDAAIAAIEDGRLGSDNLGQGLSRLLGSGLIKPGRWSKTLADVARASDAHAAVVKLALEACLDALEDAPRDYAKLLELLNELCVQLSHGIASAHRGRLEAVKGSNKVAKVARALLAVPTGNSAPLQAAVNRLTEMRVQAAKRWG